MQVRLKNQCHQIIMLHQFTQVRTLGVGGNRRGQKRISTLRAEEMLSVVRPFT